MMGVWCVSNDSSARKVYNEVGCINQIGTIVLNEAFVYDSMVQLDPNVAKVYFLSSSGTRYGYIRCGGLLYDTIFRNLRYCRLGTVGLGGTTYNLFKIQHRQEELYNPDGSFIKNLPVGTELAVDDAANNGQTKPYTLNIKGYKEPNQSWQTGSKFVDTGIRTGSGTYWSIKHLYN